MSRRPRIPSQRLSLLGAVVALALPAMAAAQEEAAAISVKPAWTIKPNVALDVTYTDNVNPAGGGTKQSDFITRVAPGITVDGKSARASGRLDFKWQESFYADNSRYDNQQTSLAATGKLELVENWMFIDASGNIAQRPISAFGTQGIANELVNTNRTETSTYRFSPYIQGHMGGYADYELRYSNTETSANAGVYAANGGTTTEAWSLRLSGDTRLAALGWSLNAERQNVAFGVRDTRTSRFYGTLEYRIDPQIKLLVNAGRESDNFNLAQNQSRSTSGYGIDWAPTERTLLALRQDQRSYGDSYSINVTHRSALSAWRFTDSRSVSLPSQQMTQAPLSSAYELLNQQLTSQYPDPAERAARTLEQLALLGIQADALVYGNLMSLQAFEQRRQEASVSLTGANNTVTFTLQRSASSRIGNAAGLVDDFTASSNIRQSGFSGNWAHKLSPHTALTFNALNSRSRGDAATQETRLRSYSLSLSTKLGVHTSATAGLRQTSFDNTGGTSYDEQAVTGSLVVSF
ncbi:MAG: TIGR03016 family PEP-CTERM system-associated outer membrane protein [Rhodocyclaceae bacterium]|nr:TIGR03016 family PEP-CTERM system-associated outer membrane protein [Rhodocyclaceae bacterium]